jgi:hypothetical protein
MNNRVLGTIAIICAPALLVEAILLQGGENALITGIASMVFMAGWICSNTAMRRMRAAGVGKWGRTALLIQLLGLVLAFAFGFFEATGLLSRESLVFNVTDIAWPLSMLWMLVVGITVVVAKRLSGWHRFVPLLCGLWLPIGMVAMVAFGDDSGLVGFGLAAIFWTALGYVVREGGEQAGLVPEPTVR